MSTYRITATYELEIVDELALRAAGFRARIGDQALHATYDEDQDDTVIGALQALLGHQTVTTVPGTRPVSATLTVTEQPD